jgi:hypothetical protein
MLHTIALLALVVLFVSTFLSMLLLAMGIDRSQLSRSQRLRVAFLGVYSKRSVQNYVEPRFHRPMYIMVLVRNLSLVFLIFLAVSEYLYRGVLI